MKITMKNWHALKENMYIRSHDNMYRLISDYVPHNNWYHAELIDASDDSDNVEYILDIVVVTPSDILGGEYYD